VQPQMNADARKERAGAQRAAPLSHGQHPVSGRGDAFRENPAGICWHTGIICMGDVSREMHRPHGEDVIPGMVGRAQRTHPVAYGLVPVPTPTRGQAVDAGAAVC